MIETSRVGDHLILRLAHGRANAMDTELMRALRVALDQATRSDARAIVITGTGTIFSAGVDLFRVLEGGRAYLEEFLDQLSGAFRELFLIPKPVVAAVNGHAIAGGCIVACACDRRVMALGSGRIGLPELRVGVPFPISATEILRHAIGPRRAQEAMLMGNNVEARAAIEHGFVDELVEPPRLMPRALEIATLLAATPPASYARTKLDLRRPVRETWARLGEAHDRETLAAWDSPAVRHAVRAFVARTLEK
jgi:enoyl-CoA hydratase